MNYNMEKEVRLIEALGLHLVGPNNDNRFLILDDEENEVGYIKCNNLYEENLKHWVNLDENDRKFRQCKKLYDNYIKKDSSVDFRYTIKINSKNIYYESSGKTKEKSDFCYELNIKREDGTIDFLELILGENASLTLKSKNYGSMSFRLNPNRLFINFMSSTENFNIEETILYEVFDKNSFREKKGYTYQIRYCPQKVKQKNGIREIKTCEISGESFSSSNKIDLADRSWYNGHMWVNNRSTVLGTVEELIYKHKAGIKAFNHFRYLINQILPFKEEIVSLMCGENMEQIEEMPFFCNKKIILTKIYQK